MRAAEQRRASNDFWPADYSAGLVVDIQCIVRNGFMTPGLRHLGIASNTKLNPTPGNHSEKARVVVIMLADQLIKAVSPVRGPIAVYLDDEVSGTCVDPGSVDSGRMRRMEQRKSKQDCEQKLHLIQCSATVLRQLGIDQPIPIARLVKSCFALIDCREVWTRKADDSSKKTDKKKLRQWHKRAPAVDVGLAATSNFAEFQSASVRARFPVQVVDETQVGENAQPQVD